MEENPRGVGLTEMMLQRVLEAGQEHPDIMVICSEDSHRKNVMEQFSVLLARKGFPVIPSGTGMTAGETTYRFETVAQGVPRSMNFKGKIFTDHHALEFMRLIDIRRFRAAGWCDAVKVE